MSIVTNLKYTANLDKGVCMTPITPSFMGGDQEAHRITVDCYRQNSRETVDLSGAGVTAYFVRADGMTIPLNGETEGNKASVLLPAACYAVMGRFSMVIKLSLGDSISTVFWGEGAVSRSRTDVVIDPDSVIPSLEELLAQIAAMEIATNNANQAAETANQAAADALKTVDDAVARQDEVISQLSEDIADLDVYDLKMVKDYLGDWGIIDHPDIIYDYAGGTWKFSDTVLNAGYVGKATITISNYVNTADGSYTFYNADFSSAYQPVGKNTTVFSDEGTYEIEVTAGLGIRLQASRANALDPMQCRMSVSAMYGESPEGKQGLPDSFVGTVQLKKDVKTLKQDVADMAPAPHVQTEHTRTASSFPDCVSSAKEQIISATATFDSFSSFSIGLTKGEAYADASNLIAYVTVDQTNVVLHYSFYGSPRTVENAHGLTITGMVGVKMEFDWTNTLRVRLTTAGGAYECEYLAPYVRVGKGYPFYSLDATNGSIIGFSCAFPKINKPVWLFGDSYFAEVKERWVYYVDRDKCFFNGYPGEGSVNALAELQYLLTIGKPKYVVWCLGMNDTNAANWTNAFAALQELSAQYGFELVMGITPTVPSRPNNEQYRTAILESGLRYIDFYSAVGANESGEWFDGLLSDDGVHPSETGGMVLAAQVYADFPEITMD